jgi:hypothetical protein
MWNTFIISGIIMIGAVVGYFTFEYHGKMDEVRKHSDIIRSINPKLDPGVSDIIAKEVLKSCKKYGLSPILVISLMYKESSFRVMAVSSANCVGLMQINPKAHPEKVQGVEYPELFHIGKNVDIGCSILKEYGEGKTVKEALEKYLGKSNKKYLEDILVMYTDITTGIGL